jgi:hypothetical protein
MHVQTHGAAAKRRSIFICRSCEPRIRRYDVTDYDDSENDNDNATGLSEATAYFLQHILYEIEFWHQRAEHLLDGEDTTLARLRGLAYGIVSLVDCAPAMDIDAVDACYELKEQNDLEALLANPEGLDGHVSAEVDAEAEASEQDEESACE